MNFKIIISLTLCCFIVSGCSWTRIGTLTMMSTRNVDSQMNYVELARYVDSDSKEAKKAIKNTKAYSGEALHLAIDRCVAIVQGGEFMKNVQVYIKGEEVKVVGDVWGKADGYALPLEDQKRRNQQAAQDSVVKQKALRSATFEIGDNVTWSNYGSYSKGVIIGKDETGAVVKYKDKSGKEQIKKLDFKQLTKITEQQ